MITRCPERSSREEPITTYLRVAVSPCRSTTADPSPAAAVARLTPSL
jgi:hypothetical protein